MIKYTCKCLGRNLSHLSDVFSIIQDEEERRNVTLDTLVEEGSILAMVTPSSAKNCGSQTLNSKSSRRETFRPLINKDGLWCNYYKKPRHAKETCGKLKGKQPFDGNYNYTQK